MTVVIFTQHISRTYYVT